tara:strand:- start:1761 stop:3821 length:2061 start_codon:yes stop_codon:yes gene_type:complete
MFQTPQRKAAGGIMAGVAPIGMNEGGDMFSFDDGKLNINIDTDETKKKLDHFFTTEETPEGSGITARDLFNTFVVDPNDPTDVAIAGASAALIGFPPAAAAAFLARLGYKGSKVARAMMKLDDVQKKIGSQYGEGFLDKLAKIPTNFMKNRVLPDRRVERTLGNEIISRGTQVGTNRLLGGLADDYVDFNIIPSAMADDQIPQEEGGIQNLVELSAMDPEREELAQISAVISESEPEEEGGITSLLPKSIKEARKMKSATFTRGGKKKAAVTKEELEESGLDSLTDFLNQMKFDEESGRYVQKKADGGIAYLAGGGSPKKIAIKEGIENTEAAIAIVNRIKQAAKTGDDDVLKLMAKEIDNIPNKTLKKIAKKTLQQFTKKQKPPTLPDPVKSNVKNIQAEARKPKTFEAEKPTLSSNLAEGNRKLKGAADDASTGTVTTGSKVVGPQRFRDTITGKIVTNPALLIGGTGATAYYGLSGDEEPEQQQGSGSGPAPAAGPKPVLGVDKPLNELTVTPRGIRDSEGSLIVEPTIGDRIRNFAKDKLTNIDPSILAGLVNMGSSTDLFEPPKTDAQKFLEGQQGYRLNEAQIGQAETQSKPALFQTFDAIINAQEELGSPLDKANQQKLLLTLFNVTQKDEKFAELIQAVGTYPQLLNQPEIIAQITKELQKDKSSISEIISAATTPTE